MAEMLVQFDAEIADGDGQEYVARVCGREAEDGLWEGWIEFDPGNQGRVLRTAAESRQPNRENLAYWAGGLTVAYLEGALQRALHPWIPKVPPRTTEIAPPRYDRPASFAAEKTQPEESS